jgi:hypothetical protein
VSSPTRLALGMPIHHLSGPSGTIRQDTAQMASYSLQGCSLVPTPSELRIASPFSRGDSRPKCNIPIAIVYYQVTSSNGGTLGLLVYSFPIYCFPYSLPAAASNMNYSCLITGGLTIFAYCWWLWRRGRYIGPQALVHEGVATGNVVAQVNRNEK